MTRQEHERFDLDRIDNFLSISFDGDVEALLDVANVEPNTPSRVDELIRAACVLYGADIPTRRSQLQREILKRRRSGDNLTKIASELLLPVDETQRLYDDAIDSVASVVDRNASGNEDQQSGGSQETESSDKTSQRTNIDMQKFLRLREQGLSLLEVAEKLGITPDEAKQTYHRAVSSIAERLKSVGEISTEDVDPETWHASAIFPDEGDPEDGNH